MNDVPDVFKDVFLPHVPGGVVAVRDRLLDLSFSQMIFLARGVKKMGAVDLDSVTPERLAHILNEWATEHKLKQQCEDEEKRKNDAEVTKRSAEVKAVFQCLDLDSQEADAFTALAKRMRENNQHEMAERIETALRAYKKRHDAA